jgi:DNA polymerase I-like protein with 3'-5' exonuclease and polymerase domains
VNTLCFDYETNTFAKGNAHSLQGKAVCLGIKLNEEKTNCFFFPTNISNWWFTNPDLVVAFNAKFDLLWNKKLGYPPPKQVWCCQLAEYMLDRQRPYPSLEETAKNYGLSNKLDVVKLEYWDKGINTTEVPQTILSDYCIQDVDLTYAIYQNQLLQFQVRPTLFKLFKLACQDLLTLVEMEWNGLKYDEELCASRVAECHEQRSAVLALLSSVYPGVPINFGSNDQLSAFLYGGTIVETVKQADGFYKSGAKKGQVKYVNKDIEYVLPRMVQPLPKSEMGKENIFSTAEGTLKKLKGPFAKKYLPYIQQLSKLDKLIGTYYEGLPNLNKEMDWQPGYLFPGYNMCVTQTGRLSSSKPNGQNLAGDVSDIIVSRYNE